MAETTKIQYVTLANLALFKDQMDAATLKVIEEKVGPTIKTISQSADKLKIYFYTKEAPVAEAEAAFSITLPAPVDISGKADKVVGAVAGNFAGLDKDGNLTDSGKKAADFDEAGSALNVQTELLKLIGSIPEGSEAKTLVDYIQQVVIAGGYDDSELRGLITAAQRAIDVLNGDENTAGSVKKSVADLKTELVSQIGTLSSLKTSVKTNLVVAINELFDKIDTDKLAAKVTIDTTTTTEGMLKSYTVKQGDTTIGVIDVPKDMVVKSGSVVKNPAGQTAGTYIELTLANAASDKLYINVGSLVDIYTAEANAAQVQLAINPSTRVISATIIAGSITDTELAANAVTTVKILDGAVTVTKVDAAIKASLAKADTAVQEVIEGTANGTIKVDGTNVNVHGLGDAAYKPSSAFEIAGAAKALEDGLIKTNTENIASNKKEIDALKGAIDSIEPIPDDDILDLFK